MKAIAFICLGSFVIILAEASRISSPSELSARKPNRNDINSKQLAIDPTFRWSSAGITVAGKSNPLDVTNIQLFAPSGLALDSSKTIYVTDKARSHVQAWLPGASQGKIVAGDINGIPGSGPTQFNSPADIAVDPSGNLYIADVWNHRVQFCTKGSSSCITVAGTGIPGNSSRELTAPQGIALDSQSGALYVADTFNHRVMKYESNNLSGSVVAGGTGSGMSNTQLNLPRGICFDESSDSLLIANSGANNIVRWFFGASTWSLVAGDFSGLVGSSPTLLNQPFDVTLDSWGNVYVADTENKRVQFFPAGQSNGTTIAGIIEYSDIFSTMLSQPSSIALDDQLNVYVTDTHGSRVQKFRHY